MPQITCGQASSGGTTDFPVFVGELYACHVAVFVERLTSTAHWKASTTTRSATVSRYTSHKFLHTRSTSLALPFGMASSTSIKRSTVKGARWDQFIHDIGRRLTYRTTTGHWRISSRTRLYFLGALSMPRTARKTDVWLLQTPCDQACCQQLERRPISVIPVTCRVLAIVHISRVLAIVHISENNRRMNSL